MAAGLGGGVLQRALQVVDDRQPLAAHPRRGVRLGPAELGRASLAEVVGVGQCPQPLVLGLGELAAQLVLGPAAPVEVASGGDAPAGWPASAGASLAAMPPGRCSVMGGELGVDHVVVPAAGRPGDPPGLPGGGPPCGGTPPEASRPW